MPFDYEANLTAVSNVLTNSNTTTSTVDLSSGLTTRVRNIFRNDPGTVSVKLNDYPCLFVRIFSKDEEFASLGVTGPNNNRKFATCRYDVIGLYHKDGSHTAHSSVLTEIYRLAENIEGVFQQELTLSGTALWCQPIRSEFFGPFQSEGQFVKGVVVQLDARYLFR